MQRKSKRASGDARAAAGDDRAIERHAGIAKQLCQLFGGLQLPGVRVGHTLVRDIAAARYMAAAQTGPGFGRGAVKPTGSKTQLNGARNGLDVLLTW